MSEQTQESIPVRVLVVDDEPSIRTVVQRFLTHGGYETDVAEDAPSALATLGKENYDVVVSDIVLPGMSGVSLLKGIRAQDPDVQVIMMTGEPTVDTAAEAIRAGACDYLTKPVGRASLVYAVQRAARIKYLLEEKKRLDAENKEYRDHLEELVERRSAELARSERRLRTILEHMQTGIFVVDGENHSIIEANPVACQMLGLDYNNIIGQDCDRFVENAPPREALAAAGSKEALPNEESWIITGKGQRKPVLITVVAAELEGRPCMVESFVDISAQKETEHRLREARQLAESASRGKSELLANVSHELRTPLNGILGMAELALNEALTEELRDYFQTIQSSGQLLLHTLSNLAELAAAGMATREDVEQQDFLPKDAIEDAVERVRTAAQAKGLELSVVDENCPAVKSDRRRVERILDCLLDNAVKFSEQGRIRIVAKPLAGPGEQPGVQIAVQDTGCGIPEGKQKAIFEPFAMADGSAARRHDGLGLGLALADRLATLVGGEISVRSRPGENSCFMLSLSASADEPTTD